MSDLTVANEILRQLGGARFVLLCGVKSLLGDRSSLTMKVGSNALRVTHVRVTLTPADLYDLEFMRVSPRGGCQTVSREHDVYADTLQATFTAGTGLYTHF